MTGSGALAGLRVLDLSMTPDAVNASTLLADLGADVVLVEIDPDGHAARRVGPVKDGVSLLWKVTGRGKRIARLPGDTASASLDTACALADVVLVDAASIRRLGLDPRDLASRHPHLVVLASTPFGLDGQLGLIEGTGRLAEAFGGQTFAAGEPDREPLHSGFPIGAASTALFGALGVVAAVIERDGNGRDEGQLIDLAGYEAVLRIMEFLPIFFQQTGFRNERTGGGSAYQVPVATWLTADDKWVTFTGNTNDIVHRLYRAMDRPDLIDDPRFATNDGRVANRELVEKTLADWARSFTRPELEARCEEHAVPIGSVFSMADIFRDENYRVRSSIVEVDDPDLGAVQIPCSVPRLTRTQSPRPGVARASESVDLDGIWPPRPAAAVGDAGGAGAPSRGPLHGLRVLDIGQILAGPFAATLMADLGADVVKVEKRSGGDDFRRQAPLHEGISLWWKASARNKRSIALDLKDEADRETFRALVANADVVTANFVPGTLERLGFSYEDLAAINPRLVMVSVSGYGQQGPFRARRAFGRNAEAYGGLAQVTGYADGPPLPTGFPVADSLSATLGALGALSAIYRRQRDPEQAGEHVDVALYETVFRLLELTALVYDQCGLDSAHSQTGTITGEVFVVAQSRDGQWVSASGWGEGPVRFAADDADGVTPGADRAALLAQIRERIAGSTLAELLGSESIDGVSFSPVNSVDELMATAHASARQTVVTVADDELGEVAVATVVPRFARTPGAVRHASPPLDGHRDQILAEWGSDAS